MNKYYAGFAGIFFIAVSNSYAAEYDKQTFANDKAVTSYSLGVQTARTFVRDDVDVDMDMFVKGLTDASSGKELLLPEDQLKKVLNNFQTELRRNIKKNRTIAAGENMRKGKEFLDENKSKPGVVVLPDGLQYKVLTAGSGKVPVDTDTVEINYRGRLINGKQFDASEQGVPAKLQVSQVVPGFKEALKMMPTGSKWEIYIPSQLAYGPRSVGSEIGPNETLIFEIELVSIK